MLAQLVECLVVLFEEKAPCQAGEEEEEEGGEDDFYDHDNVLIDAVAHTYFLLLLPPVALPSYLFLVLPLLLLPLLLLPTITSPTYFPQLLPPLLLLPPLTSTTYFFLLLPRLQVAARSSLIRLA